MHWVALYCHTQLFGRSVQYAFRSMYHWAEALGILSYEMYIISCQLSFCAYALKECRKSNKKHERWLIVPIAYTKKCKKN